jgi:hypothetical protein
MPVGDRVRLSAIDVDELLDRGLTLVDIAWRYGCSVRTVRNVAVVGGVVMPRERVRRRLADLTAELADTAATVSMAMSKSSVVARKSPRGGE